MEHDKSLQKRVRFPTPYLLETRRPIVSLAFVFPLLIIYELGVLLLGPQAIRNGLDEMVRFQLYRWGFGEFLLLPLVTVATLLVWHYLKRDRWSMRPLVVGGMWLESIFLGLILLWAAKAQKVLLDGSVVAMLSLNVQQVYSVEWWSNTVAYLGAGIYEELVFRLILLMPIVALTRRLGGWRYLLISAAMIASSLLFAALHYEPLNPAGYPLDWPSFVIRFLASLFFCMVFLIRGFGVAVGTHAAYDVLTQL